MAAEREITDREFTPYDRRMMEIGEEVSSGIQDIVSGYKDQAKLFEGDFLSPRAGEYGRVQIGSGFSTEDSELQRLFIRVLRTDGDIISMKNKSGLEILAADTNGSRFRKVASLNGEFPVDTMVIEYCSAGGVGMTIELKRYYDKFHRDIEKGFKKPLTLLFRARVNDENNFHSPRGEKQKIAV